VIDSIVIETDIFEHREVKPHFINPCCFGEDFTSWLAGQLSPMKETGFTFSQPIQEDHGWGFWAFHEKTSFWVALSYVGNAPQDPPAQWIVTVVYDPGFNLIKRLFHKPNPQVFTQLRDRIWNALKSEQRIKLF